MSAGESLRSRLLASVPGVAHGFGSVAAPVPAPFAGDWERSRARWRQVHGTAACELTGPAQECGEIDAQYTRVAGLPAAAMHADCTPILLARRDGGAVAAVHAGWRGTRAGILDALWARLAAEGERPAAWVAAVGPTIGACCYEVSEELAQDFAREFARLGPGLAVPAARRLDLAAINGGVLRALGVAEVEVLGVCTRCARADGGGPLCHSFRRERGPSRQYSVVMRAAGAP